MAHQDDDPLLAALRLLRGEYLSAAPAKMAALWKSYEQVQNGDRAALERMRTQTHHLAGSGGGYGFDDVTRHARAAETLVGKLLASENRPSAAELAELSKHLTGVADAFKRARSTE